MPYFVYLIVSKLRNKKKLSYVGYSKDLKKTKNFHTLDTLITLKKELVYIIQVKEQSLLGEKNGG